MTTETSTHDMKWYYENNLDFKMYVDRYCAIHNKTADEAFNDSMVVAYWKYLSKEYL